MNEANEPEIDPALIRRVMAEFGRRGGSKTSEAKAAAVRANGKKGGRPRRATADK